MEKSVNQPQKKNNLRRTFFTNGKSMWAILLKYTVIIRAGPERDIQPSTGCC